MTGNLTSGNGQSYEPGHGKRIFKGLKPDVALIQEFNAHPSGSTPAQMRAMVDETFGSDFVYHRGSGSIPNGVVSRYPIADKGEWRDPLVNNRHFTWALLDLPGDRDMWAISVHLLTGGAGDRNREAAALMNHVRTLPDKDYVVLGGDFNTKSRKESCLDTLSGVFVTSSPYPADHRNNGNTNGGRTKPYDWVLGNRQLHDLAVPTQIGSSRFTNGLVFDSRVYQPLSEVDPVQAGDSGSPNMQHMAVVRDFRIVP